MYIIAVTGGIGSGKTAVTDYLEELGYTVIDTDKMSHEITAPGGKAIPYIIENFGMEYISPDGSLNRSRMRELVYNNPEAKLLLENGTTRVIVEDTASIINEAADRGLSCIFVAIPLLFEVGNPEDYDLVWSVIADLNVRYERIRRRDGLGDEIIRNIISSQASDEERLEKSSDIIYNSSDLDDLYSQIDRLLDKYNLR